MVLGTCKNITFSFKVNSCLGECSQNYCHHNRFQSYITWNCMNADRRQNAETNVHDSSNPTCWQVSNICIKLTLMDILMSKDSSMLNQRSVSYSHWVRFQNFYHKEVPQTRYSHKRIIFCTLMYNYDIHTNNNASLLPAMTAKVGKICIIIMPDQMTIRKFILPLIQKMLDKSQHRMITNQLTSKFQKCK